MRSFQKIIKTNEKSSYQFTRIANTHTHYCTAQYCVQHSMINSSHTNILFQRKLATQSDCRVCVCDSFLLGGTSTEWNFQITTHTLTQRHFASLQRIMKMRSNPLYGLRWSICFACTVFLWTCHNFVSFCDHYYVLVYRFSLAIAVWLNVAHTHRICFSPCFIARYELWEFNGKKHVKHAKISAVVATTTTIATQNILEACSYDPHWSIQKRNNKRQPTRVQVISTKHIHENQNWFGVLCTLVYVMNGTNATTNKQTIERTNSNAQQKSMYTKLPTVHSFSHFNI